MRRELRVAQAWFQRELGQGRDESGNEGVRPANSSARQKRVIENWERVQTLFLKALHLRPDERLPFLEGACAGDEEMRREVESLLTHDGASE